MNAFSLAQSLFYLSEAIWKQITEKYAEQESEILSLYYFTAYLLFSFILNTDFAGQLSSSLWVKDSRSNQLLDYYVLKRSGN